MYARGDVVRVRSAGGHDLVAVVRLVADNGRGLVLVFGGTVGWRREYMVYQQDDGTWITFAGAEPVTVTRTGHLDWPLPPPGVEDISPMPRTIE